jgi:glycerol uptake facilitator protein
MTGHLVRRALAEFVGTALLVLFGAGAVVAATTAGGGRLDYAGLGIVGLSFAVAIAVAVYAFGPISGAHINPAVTVSLALVRRFRWRDVPAYIVAQLAGAVVGALLLVAIYGRGAAAGSGVGMTAVSPGVGYIRGIVGEALGTFLLLTAVMALAVDRRAPVGWAGLMIGLSVAGGIFMLGPVTGGSLNPARTFGPYVANSLFGGATPWRELIVYVVGPLLGGALAVLAYELVARPSAVAAGEAVEGAQVAGARPAAGGRAAGGPPRPAGGTAGG